MIKTTRILIGALIVVALGAAAAYFLIPSRGKTIEVSEGRVSGIETLAQLCAVEFYSEVPILDTLHNKVMFAVQKQTGSISFDLDRLRVDDSGDTIRITLSPEIVELYEATDDNSWEVIDTKAIGPVAPLMSDKFTIEEENAIKSKIRHRSKKLLYHNGTVARARKEGAANLQAMMEKVYRRPVVVTDPTPRGAHYSEYR